MTSPPPRFFRNPPSAVMHTAATDVQSIRSSIGDHIHRGFSNILPVEWENMPQRHTGGDSGWVHVSIIFERFEKVGLKGGPGLQRGRVRLVVAVPTGKGVKVMDAAVAELTRLLATQTIGEIRMGAVRNTRPETEHGYHRAVMEIGFTALDVA